MAARHIYIISDLHLGGAPARESEQEKAVGFQMCPPESRRRLARFIRHICSAHGEDATELVINGDFVDYLAEETEYLETTTPVRPNKKYESFTAIPSRAVAKLRRIIQHTDGGVPIGEQVFEALRQFVGNGHSLTILLGNHDIELSLPAVRYALLQELTEGRPACVQFLHDGEAYTRDDLLIEHGNRYDGWNAVAHGILRAYRAAVSRSEDDVVFFPPPPGSRMVTEIMNPLKDYFKFIDLLKPENEALIPVLATLDPKTIRPLRKIVRSLPLLAEKALIQPMAGGVPWDHHYIADDQAEAVRQPFQLPPDIYGDLIDQETIDRSSALLAEAEREWQDDDREDAMHIADRGPSLKEKTLGILALISQVLPLASPTYGRLRKALISHRDILHSTFRLESESPVYLKAANRLASGRRVVVFGHTHLPKRISLQNGGLYLNSGTWCPTIQLPACFYDLEQPDEVILPRLKQFIEDLKHNRTDGWCVLRTTFVKVTQQAGQTSAELFEFHSDGTINVL